jgi:hypothetical protein
MGYVVLKAKTVRSIVNSWRLRFAAMGSNIDRTTTTAIAAAGTTGMTTGIGIDTMYDLYKGFHTQSTNNFNRSIRLSGLKRDRMVEHCKILNNEN